MERRINKKAEDYMREFKNNIKDRVAKTAHSPEVSDLLQYIFDYENLTFMKEDLIKRKRIKNTVPFLERCCAKRANEEQCTRRKKDGNEYCGTHTKGTPHGFITNIEDAKPSTQQIEIWAQDICGIIYYIDKAFNVYKPEDIIVNKINPRIIAKYKKFGDKYSIPEFNI